MNKIDLNAGITAMEDGRIFSHIAALDGGDYEYLSTYMKQIAALLKAGQFMRDTCYNWEALGDACKAWDAALGEEEV